MNKSIKVSLGLGMLAITLTGCFHKAEIKKTEIPKPEEPKVAEVVPAQKPSDESNATWTDYKQVPELSNVHFDFDKYNLKPEDRKTLQDNYKALADHKNWAVRIEGYCDERGTIEYNIALGHWRAVTVKEYYSALGLNDNRISLISYGKEKPLCMEHNEGCWSQNRRATTLVRPINTQVSSIKKIER